MSVDVYDHEAEMPALLGAVILSGVFARRALAAGDPHGALEMFAGAYRACEYLGTADDPVLDDACGEVRRAFQQFPSNPTDGMGRMLAAVDRAAEIAASRGLLR